MNGTPTGLLERLQQARQRKERLLAVLIDPDNAQPEALAYRIQLAHAAGCNWVLLGGSFLGQGKVETAAAHIRRLTSLPLVLFPGGPEQLTGQADGVLLLSLISGRNPELLIGQHVKAAPRLEQLDIEILPTGYLLVDTGKPTTASYMSGTAPLPADKPELAAYTALAGQQLGLQCIYLDAGSGAIAPPPLAMVQAIAHRTRLPLIVGGGIRNAEQAAALYEAGANLVVVGTALEQPGAEKLFQALQSIRL